MTGKRKKLENLQVVGPYIISLLNGAEVASSEQGTVYLSPNCS